jgi:prepilin-type N-terminal cleavage/methylation domain-containing protein
MAACTLGNGRGDSRDVPGFTLIELLVVIAIITLLLSILLPGLGQAKKIAAFTKESAGASQLNMAYLTYANDNRDALMPGFLKYSWAHPGQDAQHQFWVYDDLSSAATRMEGTTIKRYPWRIAPYLNYDTRGLILDKNLWDEMKARPLDPPGGGSGYQRGVATHSSFGINGTYVGGDYEHGAFRDPVMRQRGRFYVQKASEPVFPTKLIIFGSARGRHIAGGNRVAPGWYRLEAPRGLSFSGTAAENWTALNTPTFDATRDPADYGYIDLRHFNKFIVTHFDGHTEALSYRQARDMRRWSNEADREDWVP